jgi:hypothetical protein
MTPAQENILGILIVGHQNLSRIYSLPDYATVPPNNINDRFKYFESYFDVLPCLESNTFINLRTSNGTHRHPTNLHTEHSPNKINVRSHI